MADHYYTKDPTSQHKPGMVEYEYRGHKLRFDTDSGVFSRTEIDRGTHELLAALPESLEGRLLDLGCGYGYYTHYFDEAGAHAIGVDGAEAMIQIARKRYPGSAFPSWICPDRFRFRMRRSTSCFAIRS